MASKIIKLIENKELARKLAKKGREYILKNFSVEKAAEKFYNAFIE